MALSSVTSLAVLAALLASAHAQFQHMSSMSTVNTTEDIIVDAILPPGALLQVYAVPVGQGDCTIIQCPTPGNILVLDCGSSGGKRMTSAQVQAFLGNQIGRVVAIMITHPDRDHFNYLDKINWQVPGIDKVIIGGTLANYNRPSTDFMNIYNWLLNFQNMGKLFTVNNGASCIGNCPAPGVGGTNFCNNQNIPFNILAANAGTTSNQKSIVMKVTFSMNQWSMLLPGDIEGTAATNIANTLGNQLQSSVYKMAHHGASTQANSVTWLAPILPGAAFASSAYNFGNCRHPRCVTINRITNLNTVTPAPSHDFYCGNGPGVAPTNDNNYLLNMFETSPSANTICSLHYTSGFNINQDCFQALLSSDERVGDDECPEEFEAEGGAASAMVSYTTIIAALLYYFVTTA